MNPAVVTDICVVLASLMVGIGFIAVSYRAVCWVYDHGRPTSPARDELARRFYGHGLRFAAWGDQHPGLAIGTVIVALGAPPVLLALFVGQAVRTIAALIGGATA